MTEGVQTYQVRAVSDSFPHRAVVETGNHQFLVDSARGPGEEINPIQAFLGGVAACGVTLIEETAEELGVPLRAIDAAIEATRLTASPEKFERVTLTLTMTGPDEQQAQDLADRFSRR
ncbi:MAG TPA: OsmC family protein [Chloroflexota bacterium]|nr:OsmC family protein [Chloroflexota bacterium]